MPTAGSTLILLQHRHCDNLWRQHLDTRIKKSSTSVLPFEQSPPVRQPKPTKKVALFTDGLRRPLQRPGVLLRSRSTPCQSINLIASGSIPFVHLRWLPLVKSTYILGDRWSVVN